jgi:hypothetical protein
VADVGCDPGGARVGRICDRCYSLLSGAGSASRALVVNDDLVAPVDIIVLSLDSGGAGALEAADLVQIGISKRVAVFKDPPSGEDHEFIRRGLLGLINLPERTVRELWYDSATRKNPMEWVTETFKAVNNGRLADVSLPKSIDLLIPHYGHSFGELEISVIDTKGIDDVAVREDLDSRLKDPRTALIFCSRFNDAPGTTTRVLLQHMRQTFSDDTGKVSILAPPRAGEARATKDDMGEQALSDSEGYEFKRLQVSGELAVDDLRGVPMIFFNVESDELRASVTSCSISSTACAKRSKSAYSTCVRLPKKSSTTMRPRRSTLRSRRWLTVLTPFLRAIGA